MEILYIHVKDEKYEKMSTVTQHCKTWSLLKAIFWFWYLREERNFYVRCTRIQYFLMLLEIVHIMK